MPGQGLATPAWMGRMPAATLQMKQGSWIPLPLGTCWILLMGLRWATDTWAVATKLAGTQAKAELVCVDYATQQSLVLPLVVSMQATTGSCMLVKEEMLAIVSTT